MKNCISLVCGVLFGTGLLLSGMTDPSVVIGFLDLSGLWSGQWNPSLLFVMVGALAVYLPLYFMVVKQRIAAAKPPVFASRYHLPANDPVDRPLLLGSACFGLGWGISGICPGPGVVSIALGSTTAVWFVTSMLGGIYLAAWLTRRNRVSGAMPAQK